MSKIRLFCLALLIGFVTSLCGNSVFAASFLGLGDLAGGTAAAVPISTGDPTYESQATGVSPNGNIVVGKSVGSGAPPSGNSTAFKWTTGGGMVDIGDHPTAVYYSVATGATNNDIVVGYGDRIGNYNGQVMQWGSPAGSSAPALLPLLPPWQQAASYTGDNPVAINAGGQTVIAGFIAEIPYFNSYEATVWVNGSLKRLGWLGPGPMSPPPNPTDPPRGDPGADGYKDYSYAFGVNTSATHIVGYSGSGNAGDPVDEADPKFTPSQAILWHDPTGTWATPPAAVGLGQIGGPSVGVGSSGADITNNGLTVVGSGCSTNSCGGASPTGIAQAFRGTVGNTNLTGLGVLPVNNVSVRPSSRAVAIAGDGTTIVGWSTTDPVIFDTFNPPRPINVTARTAFIWDPVLTGGTMMSLQSYLTSNQGLGGALAGWTLKEANGISDDGKVIVGTGINPQGNYEAFRVVLDLTPSNNGDYSGNGIVDAADYTLWRNSLGRAVTPGTGADGNGNGTIDTPDYAHWKTRFGMNVGSAAGSGSLAVPEPSAWLVLVMGILSLTLFARRRLALTPCLSALAVRARTTH